MSEPRHMKLLCVDKSAETCAKLLHKIHECYYLSHTTFRKQILWSLSEKWSSYSISQRLQFVDVLLSLRSSCIQFKDTSSSLGYNHLSFVPYLCILNPSLGFTAPQQRLNPSQCKCSRNTMVHSELIWVKMLSMKHYCIWLALK